MARPRVTASEQVLDAAARRLASHGVARTSVDDVAAEAGVSRATVYRYVGGKDDIVRAVITRESEDVLARAAEAISSSATATAAIGDGVAAALTAIGDHPVLARLTTSDLDQTLPFLTTQAAPIVAMSVATLVPVMRSTHALAVDDRSIDTAMDEVTRFVLSQLTTPRRDRSRLDPVAAGQLAATLIAPLLEPS